MFDNDGGSDNVNDFGRGADKIDLSAVAGVDGFMQISMSRNCQHPATLWTLATGMRSGSRWREATR